MSASIDSPARRRRSHRRPRRAGFATARPGLGVVLLTIVAAASQAGAEESPPPTTADSPTRFASPLPDRVDQRWRARGVACVDLPFGLRARYDARTLHRPAPGDELEAAFSDRSTAFDPTSDAVGRARLLESRFTLSRALARHVEVELSWATRSPLSRVDLLRIEDQRVAAMIRFVP